MSKLYVDNINPNSSWTGEEIAGNTVSPPGAVLQVQGITITSAELIGTLTTSAATLAVPLLSATITPISTSSKILVNVNATFGYNTGSGHCRLRRTEDGTDSYPFRGDASASNNSRMSKSHRPAGAVYDHQSWSCDLQFIDSPSSTNELMYGLEVFTGTSYTATWYLNRSNAHTNYDYQAVNASSITLMEIAG
jgi:hypothetical protein